MKFRIDDRVKIISADKQTSTHSTRSMIGSIGIITKLSGVPTIPYTIHFKNIEYNLNFMEKELKRVTVIGDQLLFSFME